MLLAHAKPLQADCRCLGLHGEIDDVIRAAALLPDILDPVQRIADGLRGRPQAVVALAVSVACHRLYVIPIRRRRGPYARKKTGKVRAPGLQLPGCQEQQVLWYLL